MTKEQLNELSIYALRNIARKTGVESPTSKKKEQLINEILLILDGKLAPHVSKNRQGRPPKNLGMPYVDNYGFEYNPFSDYVTLNQMQSDFVYDDITTLIGYVDLSSNGAMGVVVKDGDRYLRHVLPTTLVEEYRLKTGDMLLMEISELGIVQTIYEINNTLAKNFKPNERRDFANIKHVEINRHLGFKTPDLDSLNMKIGENIYLYGDDNAALTQMCVKLANNSNIKRKIYVNLSLTEKNKSVFSEFDQSVEVLTLSLLEDQKMSQFIASLAIERAKRLVENGEDVLIILDDLKTLYALDTEGKNISKNLVSLTKDSIDSGSVTLIAVKDNSPSLELFEKLADKRIHI